MNSKKIPPGIQNRQTFDFCNRFAPKGYNPLSDFYQIGYWVRVLDLLAASRKISSLPFYNNGLTVKIVKKW